MNVAVVGASRNPDRYSYKALMLLREKGHTVFPVHPVLGTIETLTVYPSLLEIPAALDVVTLYVGLANQAGLAEDLLQCRPRRVIFNPGTENPALSGHLLAAGIEAIHACTLVLLRTEQFDL